ncbi:MAG: WYL domain-containing protein, partial [Propionibacteriaceae bacterium]|nr:WYL domain-containing protein [Propionibacteriaceae bacterium]
LAHTAEAELLAPTSTARVAAFEPLWQALVDGRRVRFDYQRAGAQPVTRRQVEPWGIVSHKGNWYLIGHDIDRADVRMFKLARIVDEPVADGPAGMVQVPESLDLRALAERLEPGQPTGQAVLAIRVGRAPWLGRQGSPVTVEGPGAGLPGFETYAVGFGALDGFATDLAALGSDVLVLEPPELRALVRRHLAGVGGRTAQSVTSPGGRAPRAMDGTGGDER